MTAYRPVLAGDALAGLRIYVTGAGSGIGRAIVLRLTALGAVVGGCGRNAAPLEETAAQVHAGGGRFDWQVCDVRDSGAAADALQHFAAQGGLHGLVNNAGGQFHARAEDISPRGFNAVVDLNLNAVFALARAAFDSLRQQGGCILNLSISPVERGGLGLAHSIAARSGVLGLVRALALEWGSQGIRVNCLAPAAVDTEALRAKCSPEALLQMGALTPLGRNASVEEVAELAAFLLSPAAALITGQVIRLDAGAFLGAPLDLRPEMEAMTP